MMLMQKLTIKIMMIQEMMLTMMLMLMRIPQVGSFRSEMTPALLVVLKVLIIMMTP